MQPGTQVVPAALAARGVAHDLARAAGDIQLRARRVMQLHVVQRAVHVQRGGMGVRVFFHQAQIGDGSGRRLR